MECERLKRQIKNWYEQVQDEAMAPARMVDFMRKHVDECETCLADPIVEMEINRITEIVLPPSKIPKAVRREEEKEPVGNKDAVQDGEDTDESVGQNDDGDEDLDPEDDADEI